MDKVRIYIPALGPDYLEILMTSATEARKVFEYLTEHGIRADLVIVKETVEHGKEQ
jgi:hypothetical protein